jgi:ornithine cyclodeaminase/alanine dehydrogenase-like protein (mu-crystallin family)
LLEENPALSDPAVDFLYLSEPDMIAAGVTDMASCIEVMEQTFVLLHRGDYRMSGSNNDSHGALLKFPETAPFAGMPTDAPDRRYMAMPAYLGGDYGTTGVKWYGSNQDNRDKGLPRSILMFMLNDTDTGAPLALMSANLLSAYRTGAVPGVGAAWLSMPQSRVVGIVGPGVMARTSLEAFVAARPGIDTVKVKGRSAASVARFAEWVSQTFPHLAVVEVETIEDAVRDSDIVTYCTTNPAGDVSKYPLVQREWVKPGAFLSMPSACNLDDAMVGEGVVTVLDNTRMYEAWAVEHGYPSHREVSLIGCKFVDLRHAGVLAPQDLVDLGAVVAGDATGRRTDEDIIVLSVGGMPVEDVAWGTTLYRNAIDKGIGTKLNLWERPALA